MDRKEAAEMIQDDIRKHHDYLSGRYRKALRMAVEALSVDIVRCKDCKHYEKYEFWSACGYWSGDPYEQAGMGDDDFCSYGERR